MPRLANSRGIKDHWNYTVAEVARLVSVTRNTVRNWIKDGLPIVSDGRPYLVRGHDLKAYLDTRNAKRKRPLAPGEFYCLACHAPKRPAGNMADYVAITPSGGALQALCEACESIMMRRGSIAGLDQAAQGLDLGSSAPEPAIQSSMPGVNGRASEGVQHRQGLDTVNKEPGARPNYDLKGSKDTW